MPSDRDLETPATLSVADLVQRYSALLFRVAYSILRSSAEAEDVVQDVFMRVLQKQTCLAEIRDLRVWLVRIAWNLSLDRRRRSQPEQLDEAFARNLASLSTPADQLLVNSARVASVLREIDRLPGKEREVMLLSALEDLDTSAIAQILSRSESATRALLHRARTRLRERLSKGDPR